MIKILKENNIIIFSKKNILNIIFRNLKKICSEEQVNLNNYNSSICKILSGILLNREISSLYYLSVNHWNQNWKTRCDKQDFLS